MRMFGICNGVPAGIELSKPLRDRSDERCRDLSECFATHGVVLVRGQGLGLDAFEALTHLFGRQFIIHPNTRIRISLNKGRTTTTGSIGYRDVPLHNEMHYSPDPSRAIRTCWFCCVEPPIHGGATTLCNGAALLRAMDSQTRTLFLHEPIQYCYTCRGESWRAIVPSESRNRAVEQLAAWPGVEVTATDTSMVKFTYQTMAVRSVDGEQYFSSSILDWTSPPGSDLFVQFARPLIRLDSDIRRAIRYAGEACLSEVQWECGDILLFDNHRFLHGRRAFQGRRLLATRFSSEGFPNQAEPSRTTSESARPSQAIITQQ
jgi:alpha-ketoglutarate-dependent taurine dioxygenase